MTALDMSPFIASNTDSEELRAFKAKVAEVAKKYTNRYGWCTEANKALAELGITPEKVVSVTVVTTQGFEMKVPILPSLLHEKDEDQQKQILAERIGSLSISGSGQARVNVMFRVSAEHIAQMELPTPGAAPAAGTPAPDGYAWLYVEGGRVLHLMGPDIRGYGRRDSLCGRASSYNFRDPRNDGTDAYCRACVSRAERQ